MATAILNGTVIDDGGLPCEGRFQYGLAPGALITDTPWRNALATGDSFQWLVNNLPGGILIYFRAQVRNALGTVSGLVLSFTTIPRIPVVVTMPATDISTTGATLHGALIEDMGIGCDWAFEYGGTPAYGSETLWISGIAAPAAFQTDVVGLSSGDGVHFRAKCRNKYGIGYGQDRSFTTLSNRGPMSDFPMEYYRLLEVP